MCIVKDESVVVDQMPCIFRLIFNDGHLSPI